MNKNFCPGCDTSYNTPECAIRLIPINAYLEDIITNKSLKLQEVLICHKNAQAIKKNKMKILPNCDDCALCLLSCPYINLQHKDELLNFNLEEVIFKDLDKACILFQRLFPEYQVASEVHVNGNFRTKRVDIVIKNGSSIYLIKLLKNADKFLFYRRSYKEVINQYSIPYSNFTWKSYCLVPSSLKVQKNQDSEEILNINILNKIIGGK